MTVAVRVDTLNATASWASSSEGASHSLVPKLGQPTLELQHMRIAKLLTEEDPASNDAAANATKFLHSLFDRATKLGSWVPPHITKGETGEVVFEWWRSTKKITLYFGSTDAEYIKVWGMDIENEMESGELVDGWPVTALWLWLNS